MLILSRRIDESIRIDDDITVTVLEIQGRAVRLGIDAPPEVRVDRSEVSERRRAEGGPVDDGEGAGEAAT